MLAKNDWGFGGKEFLPARPGATSAKFRDATSRVAPPENFVTPYVA